MLFYQRQSYDLGTDFTKQKTTNNRFIKNIFVFLINNFNLRIGRKESFVSLFLLVQINFSTRKQ